MSFTGCLNYIYVVGGSVATVSFIGCLHYICVDGGWIAIVNFTVCLLYIYMYLLGQWPLGVLQSV